jgi:hypothetical protein
VRDLEPGDVGEHEWVRELLDDLLLDLAAPRVALEQRIALLLVAREEEPQDVARVDDGVVGFILRIWDVVLAQGLRPVTN